MSKHTRRSILNKVTNPSYGHPWLNKKEIQWLPIQDDHSCINFTSKHTFCTLRNNAMFLSTTGFNAEHTKDQNVQLNIVSCNEIVLKNQNFWEIYYQISTTKYNISLLKSRMTVAKKSVALDIEKFGIILYREITHYKQLYQEHILTSITLTPWNSAPRASILHILKWM